MSQPLPLREQLKALESLQEIDLKIASMQKNKGTLPATLRALDEGLAKLKATIDQKQKTIGDLDKSHKQTHAAQEINRDRLARANSKLEGVQNSHEFQAANKEIEQLKKLSGTLEEQAKKAAAEMETLNKEVADLNAQSEKLKSEREEQFAKVTAQNQKFDGEIAALTGERAQYTAHVEPRILALYDRVRAARAGLGLVPAIGGRCKGCNMIVPPQQFIEIQRGNQLHQCPSCHRILYVAEQPAATATNAAV